MSQICPCPRNAALASIPNVDCSFNIGQLWKVLIQRLVGDTGAPNGFTGTVNSPALLASWTPLLTATNSTKVVVSPLVQGATSSGGEARTFGGGNETPGGVEIILGSEPTTLNGFLRSVNQKVVKVMKEYKCEEIGLYLVTESGGIVCRQVGTDANPAWRPIPLQSYFVGDLVMGGFEALDSNPVTFGMPPNWSDDLVIVKPTDFDAKTLKNA